jgi:hypothetical protein
MALFIGQMIYFLNSSHQREVIPGCSYHGANKIGCKEIDFYYLREGKDQ